MEKFYTVRFSGEKILKGVTYIENDKKNEPAVLRSANISQLVYLRNAPSR